MNASPSAAFVSLCLTALACVRLPRRLPPATSFEGRSVRAAGVLLDAAVLAGIIVAALASGRWSGREHGAAAVAVAGFGLFGWLDDCRGDRSASGFRGHIGAALSGRFTTGFWKVLGGGAAALIAAWPATRAEPAWRWLAAAAFVALSANAFNLVDTRPVRAAALFTVLGMPVWLVSRSAALASGLGAALAWLPADRGRRVMLGDAGSNALGALLAVVAAPRMPVWLLLSALAALAAFHWWTERHSLNSFVAERPVLARLDAWMRGGG